MLKSVMMTMGAVAVSASVLAAQSRPAQPTTASKPAAETASAKAETAQRAPAEPPPMPVNIRIEVSITDQLGSGTPARKVVSMIAGDRQSTNIRSTASVPLKGSSAVRNVTINVDARPVIVQKEPTKVNINLGLEYFPKTNAGEEVELGLASFSERLGVILESGKPMIISQAADPTSDRKITVEVTATILK